MTAVKRRPPKPTHELRGPLFQYLIKNIAGDVLTLIEKAKENRAKQHIEISELISHIRAKLALSPQDGVNLEQMINAVLALKETEGVGGLKYLDDKIPMKWIKTAKLDYMRVFLVSP